MKPGSITNPKIDTRPPLGAWAPGEYFNVCRKCRRYFVGDKRATNCADCAYLKPDTSAKLEPAISAAAFEAACNNSITGWLWDKSFSLDYQEVISLTVREMRHIANALRAAEGLDWGFARDFNEDEADSDLSNPSEEPKKP